MKTVITLILAIAFISVQADAAAKEKIGMKKARAIATQRVPGHIKSGELEKEKGRWIYSFDITKKGTKGITEVNVDAYTGKVLSVEKEDPKAEKAEEKKEKSGH